MKKEHVATIRFSESMWSKLSGEAEKYELSKAEAVRRCVKYFLTEDKVLIPLNWRERNFIEDIAQNLGVDPTQAVRMILLTFKVLMSSGLLKLIKPIDELLKELESEGGEGKIGNSE